MFKERTMPTEDEKKRRDPKDPKTGRTGGDSEPSIVDDDADLDDDQADSGPDRDRKDLGG
jgi:hypothetical protein